MGPTAVDLSPVIEHDRRISDAQEARRLEAESAKQERIARGNLRAYWQKPRAQAFY